MIDSVVDAGDANELARAPYGFERTLCLFEEFLPSSEKLPPGGRQPNLSTSPIKQGDAKVELQFRNLR